MNFSEEWNVTLKDWKLSHSFQDYLNFYSLEWNSKVVREFRFVQNRLIQNSKIYVKIYIKFNICEDEISFYQEKIILLRLSLIAW